jgi:hypothetical protein
VVFCGDSELPLLRLLRPGFRHVFAVLPASADGPEPGGWISVDPLIDRMELALHPPCTVVELAGWFRHQGLITLNFFLTNPPRRHSAPWAPPLAPFTCVEVVKRLLGLRAPWVLTPYQLYRHLGGHLPPVPLSRSMEMARLVSSGKSAGTPAPVTLPTSPAPLQPATPLATNQPPTAGQATEPTAAETSLLRRSAGRAGTIATGWRGILLPSGLGPTRKNLLGE